MEFVNHSAGQRHALHQFIHENVQETFSPRKCTVPVIPIIEADSITCTELTLLEKALQQFGNIYKSSVILM